MKFRRSIYNTIFGLITQIIILIFAILIPRLVIVNFGSEVNGLFSSVGQIYTYVALLEAGVGAATLQVLYRPIVNDDKKTVSDILTTTHKYYKKISFYYLVCVVSLSIAFPFIIKSEISKLDIFFVFLLQGLVGVINFYFQATLKLLLTAEGKNYVNVNIAFIVQVLISITKIILINLGYSIILIQVSYFIVHLIQMIIYYFYFKRHYSWVDLDAEFNAEYLSQKNAFLIHQLSGLIFANTSVILLTIFCDLKVVSVYAIYNLIFVSITTIVSTVHNGVKFTLGQTFNEDKNNYLNLHNAYENYYVGTIFSLFTITYILILPFLKIYTRDITDVNYIDQRVALLFCLIQLFSATRVTSGELVIIAGYAKQTISRTITESVINLTISIILVNFIGIYGVLIGVLVAIFYRANDLIIYSNKKILNKSTLRSYLTMIINLLLFTIVVLIFKRFTFNINTYLDFVKYGIIISAIIIPLFIIVNSLTNLSAFKYVLSVLKNNIFTK